MSYTPPQKIIDRYADLLVNFALNSGKGIERVDVVLLQVPENAKPLYVALRNTVIKAGGTCITQYLPDGVAREYYDLASPQQLGVFHGKYLRGLVDEIDHTIFIVAETDMHELEGVDPRKIMQHSRAHRKYYEWRDDKEHAGKFTWTVGLWGTEAMAAEAHLGVEEYWEQIIHACFLAYHDPKIQWKKLFLELDHWRGKLNALAIDTLHIEGYNIDLTVGIGLGRSWFGGSGRNIPSFELFTSPDCRKTEGTIAFNQPLYRYGYKDTYPGKVARVSKMQWKKMGYNDSVIHTDIITTTKRTVTATLRGGKKKIIYKDGEFTI